MTDAPADAPPEPEGTADRPRRERAALVIALAAVLLPVVVALARVPFQSWVPTGDHALLDLGAGDVGTSNTPLLGPYSRFGWRHPGPWLFYALAPAWRATNSSALSMLATAAVINGAALVTLVVVAFRRLGGIGALWFAALLGVLLAALDSSFLWDPWNPLVTVLPLVVVVVLTWLAVTGDRWMLPVAVGVGALIVASHVGHAVVVGAVIVAAIALAALDGRARQLAAPVLVSFAVGGVLLVPTLVDQASGDGNLRAIVEFFGDGNATAGLAEGARIVLAQLTFWSPWLGAGEAQGVFTGEVVPPDLPIPLVLVALAALVVTGWSRRSTGTRLGALVLVVVAASIVAVSRVVGPVLWYLARWTWAVGLLAVLAIGVITWDLIGEERRERSRQFVALGLAIVAVAFSVGVSLAVASTAEPPASEHTAPMQEVVDALDARIVGVDGPVIVAGHQTIAAGVVRSLERAGVEVVVPSDQEYRYDAHRAVDVARPPALALVVALDDEVDDALADAMLAPIVVTDSLTASERSELSTLRRDLAADAADLDAIDRRLRTLDTATRARYDDLTARDVRIAVLERR